MFENEEILEEEREEGGKGGGGGEGGEEGGEGGEGGRREGGECLDCFFFVCLRMKKGGKRRRKKRRRRNLKEWIYLKLRNHLIVLDFQDWLKLRLKLNFPIFT